MQNAKRHIAVILLVCAVLAGGLWIGIRQITNLGEGPDALTRAERALSAPGMIALAQVDVPALRALLEKAEATRTAASLDFDRGLLEPIGLRGVAIGRSVDRALIAVTGSEAGGPRLRVVLFGSFDPQALEAAMRAAAPEIRQSDEGGERVLQLSRLDLQTCAETSWNLALRADRIVIGNEKSLGPLLTALGPADPRRPRWLPNFARRPLASLTLAPASELPSASAHPLARAVLRGAQRVLPGVERVSLTADRTALLGGLDVQLDVTARDPAAAAALAAQWEAARSNAPTEEWAQIAPALAAWVAQLRIDHEGNAMRAGAERGSDAVRELRDLPASAIVAASREAGEAAPAGAVDEVEPWPTLFLENSPLGRIPSYGTGRGRTDTVDTVAGPFGIRLESAARTTAGDPLELTIGALGPVIANLPEPELAPRMTLEHARSASGEELLREERCGPDRNTGHALVRRQPVAEVTQGRKTIRLAPGARLDALEKIEGHVEFDLPEHTRTERLEQPRVGQTLAGAGATVEITSATPSSFSYRVLGDTAHLVHIRGLNRDRASLASREAWETDLPLGEGRIGARRYAGKLQTIEAVFALDSRHASYPFALTSARPGSDGNALQVESSLFIQYTNEQYQKEFGRFGGHPWPQDRHPLGVTNAAAFTVALTELPSGATLAPRLTVLTPAIPNLTYNATGLELSLREVGLLDGNVLRPSAAGAGQWSALVHPHHRYGKDYLEGAAAFDTAAPRGKAELSHVAGELVLRLPEQVETVEIPEMEPGSSASGGDVKFTLRELSRDGFALHMSGPVDRFFSAQAFGENGQELGVDALEVPLTRGPEPRDLRFRVYGQPHRIVIQVTRQYTAQRIPFRIQLVDPALAP